MNNMKYKANRLRDGIRLALALPLLGVLAMTDAQAAINLTVVDHAGAAVSGFRYLVETDSTFKTTPGVRDVNAASLNFHKSDAPVLAEGQTAAASASITSDRIHPGDRVYVSVLPYEGKSIGGAMATVDATGNVNVEVTVENNPIPTAQMSVYVFHDIASINNASDGINEQGSAATCNGPDHFCPQDFTVQIVDGGGGYGVAGPGPLVTDAFGNPLGTVYDLNGGIETLGNGIIHPNENGLVVVKNLVPGKYGINIIPPEGQGWSQTTTIEGTKTVDAWIHAGNPAFINEWGPTFYHISLGFIKEFNHISGVGGATIEGTIVNDHFSAPPLLQSNPGALFPVCRIGLNTVAGVGIYSGRCDANSHFSIPNVPDGSYQLVAWDDNLELIVSFYTVDVVDGTATIAGADATGKIIAPKWFHNSKHLIFNDTDGDGFHDAGEVGIANKTVNLRFRDGRVYQTSPTDSSGEAEFTSVFPFFHWLVAESDFARDKATGVTVVVDEGGELPVNSTGGFPDYGVLTAQPQICTLADALASGCTQGAPLINVNTNDNLSRTETGPALLEAFQGFAGQTNVYEWGRKAYTGIENGGITGIVFYSNTRAEGDPRYGVGDPWEPGVARVQVALYADGDKNNLPIGGEFPGAGGEDVDRDGDHVVDAPDGIIDDINGSGGVDRADVDNYPFGWADGGTMGPEDVDNHPADTAFNKGDAITIVTTDAWDDNKPTGCQGPGFSVADASGTLHPKDCFDGLRNYNQSRPGVFDGGYAIDKDENGAPLKPAKYIVEASPPQGFEIVKEEDVNVTIGDAFEPNPLLLPPVCVGTVRNVPEFLSLHTDALGSPVVTSPEAAPFAGLPRPLCDLKQVDLQAKQNGVAEFHVFTKVPRSARAVGVVFNDVLAAFDPTAPNAGEKAAAAWIPIAFRDHTGREVSRVLTDEWGGFDAHLPSTFTANAPLPSGFSPLMLNACVNDSGIVPNPAYSPGSGGNNNNLPFIQDPNYNPTLASVCYTLQYMPGQTTYLDTPTLSRGAFANNGVNPVDCEQPTNTPMIASAEGVLGGPYVQRVPGGLAANRTARTLTVKAVGNVQVPNPKYIGDNTQPKTIARNYGLSGASGTAPQVKLTRADGTSFNTNCTSTGSIAFGAAVTCGWSGGLNGTNTVTVQFGPTFPEGTYDLMLHNAGGAAGKWSPSGVKVSVGISATEFPAGNAIHHVNNGEQIQPVIDAAAPNDLILVGPGIYSEQLIMDKPLRLQGSGAPTTFIFAQKTDSQAIPNWRTRLQTSVDNGNVTLLPPLTGQVAIDFINEEVAGVTVLGKNDTPANGGFGNDATHPNARIDGFTVTGADNGGAINVHGYADYLEISNNIVKGNTGNAVGGIQIGRLDLVNVGAGTYTDASNDNIRIHNNLINNNGALGTGTNAVGGALGLYTGTDGYQVKENFICGNFAQGDGAGIGHQGLSLGTAQNATNVIEKNTVIFNQTIFTQGSYGGGISVAGADALAGLLTEGSGPVVINANRIEGNHAASGDGGGVSLRFINGQDVSANVANGYKVSLTNNIIANNVASFAGGGIAMQDAVQVNIAHNTVVNNDSTATDPGTFGLDPNLSERQPAGIVSRTHSLGLNDLASVTTTFSNPLSLVNNIVWHNRSFQWTADNNNDGIADDPGFIPNIGAGQVATYDDFGVLPIGAGSLSPTWSIVSNLADDPGANNAVAVTSPFERERSNGNRAGTLGSSMATAAVFDEAGAAVISVEFGPLTLVDPTNAANLRDYHLKAGIGNPAVNSGSLLVNPVINVGAVSVLGTDYDAQARTRPDKGADERLTNVANTAINKGTVRILP